jgi:hypothetical protein
MNMVDERFRRLRWPQLGRVGLLIAAAIPMAILLLAHNSDAGSAQSRSKGKKTPAVPISKLIAQLRDDDTGLVTERPAPWKIWD